MSARRKFCSGGRGVGNSKKAPHKYKNGLPHAEKLAKKPQYREKLAKRPEINIVFKYSYIFASENVIQNAPNYKINKHSGEYAPIYP